MKSSVSAFPSVSESRLQTRVLGAFQRSPCVKTESCIKSVVTILPWSRARCLCSPTMCEKGALLCIHNLLQSFRVSEEKVFFIWIQADWQSGAKLSGLFTPLSTIRGSTSHGCINRRYTHNLDRNTLLCLLQQQRDEIPELSSGPYHKTTVFMAACGRFFQRKSCQVVTGNMKIGWHSFTSFRQVSREDFVTAWVNMRS